MRTSRSTVAQSSSPTSAALAAELVVGQVADVVGDRLAAAELPELVVGRALAGRGPSPRARRPAPRGSTSSASRRRGASRPGASTSSSRKRLDRLGQVLVVEDLVALGVDRLALLVDDVVELDDALADVEVEALDAALGATRSSCDTIRDSMATSSSSPSRSISPVDPVAGEALHQVVVERQVEARRPGSPWRPARPRSWLSIRRRVVALGADDVQAARRDDPLVVLVGDGLGLGEGRVVCLLVHLGRVEAALVERLGGEAGRVAAEQDVGAAAGHVRRDRDRAGPAGLGDDARLLLVELGVEDLVLDAAALEHRRPASRTSRPRRCRRGPAGRPPASRRSRR